MKGVIGKVIAMENEKCREIADDLGWTMDNFGRMGFDDKVVLRRTVNRSNLKTWMVRDFARSMVEDLSWYAEEGA